MNAPHDVIVLGGGAAGLSAALVLSRARRSVLVIDDAQPRNRTAEHMHGFLSRDGSSPQELLSAGRSEVRSYGGEFLDDTALAVTRTDGGFAVESAGGVTVSARRLLVATGLWDELPDVPGIQDRWGIDVLHCPYCHGWEVRDQPIVVLATGPAAMHQAQLFRQWSADITVVAHSGPGLTGADVGALAAQGIAVVQGPAESLQISDGHLTGLRLSGGRVEPAHALVVFPYARPRIQMLGGLGLRATVTAMGDYLSTDENGQTEIPGVWAAGNISDLKAQVIVAAADGVRTAAALNLDLIEEDVAAARSAVPSAATSS